MSDNKLRDPNRDCIHGRQKGKCPECDVIDLESENERLENNLAVVLAERNQLRQDLKAEQEGNMELRKRFGARDDETFPAFVERLATAADTVMENFFRIIGFCEEHTALAKGMGFEEFTKQEHVIGCRVCQHDELRTLRMGARVWDGVFETILNERDRLRKDLAEAKSRIIQ